MTSSVSAPEPTAHRHRTNGTSLKFGQLLRQARRRAGLTLAQLAAAVGYSVAHVGNLETGQRLADVTVVLEKFLPALGLQHDAQTARRLVELAAAARGERPPAGDDAPSGLASFGSPTEDAQHAGLPVPLLPLIGRTQTLKTVSQRLLDHGGRLFTLVGPPGIGKTTLGLAVAAHLQEHFADGVTIVPLVTVTDAQMVGPAMMTALGLAESNRSVRSPKVRLVDYLRRRQMLLLLDNFEQVTPATPLLVELLQECPGLHLLVTSRAALRVRAEQRFNVPPLGLDDAVEFFVQRVQAAEPDFVFDQASRPLIAEICQRLDCLPLALELVAARVDLFTLHELAHRLRDHPLDLLRDEAPDLDPRHQTLRAAIQWSYSLLSASEQALFRRLGVFAGGFDLAAVESICDLAGANPASQDDASSGSLATHLSALLNKSLVQAEAAAGGMRRFKLLETLREYALEQLAATGELEPVRHRHASYFCTLAEIANPELRGPDEIAWMDRLEREHDNFRAAMSWSLDQPPACEFGLRIVAMLWMFWYSHSHLSEGLSWLRRALDQAQDAPPAVRAKLLQGATNFYWSNRVPGYRTIGHRMIDESVALFRDVGDRWNQAKSLGYVGFCTERYEEFAPAAEEAKRLYRAINDDWGYAWIIFMEGYVADPYLDDLPIEVSVALMRKINAKTGLALSLQMQALKALWMDNYPAARKIAEEAIALWNQIGNQWVGAAARFILGTALRGQHEFQQAAIIYQEALLLAQRVGDGEQLARLLHGLAMLVHTNGNHQQAYSWMYEALVLLTRVGEPSLKTAASCLRGLAVVVNRQGRPLRACTLFAAASALFPPVGRYDRSINRVLYEAELADIQRQLDPAAFAAAWAAGEAMTLDQVFDFALEGSTASNPLSNE